MRSYFVTGIGTGVGKTLVSAVLTEALNADYWKPVQTGPLEDGDRARVKHLVSNSKTTYFEEAYWFKEPTSPHLAAFLENSRIHETQINLPASQNRFMVIEGAGGLLVPLNDGFFVIDLAKRFGAEVILVCRSYLGCINHSLLSIDYLIKNGFQLKGLVLNGKFDPLLRSTLQNYANTPILAELDELSDLNKESVRQLARTINLEPFA